MDNYNPASAAIPNFKLAKVGKERKSRRGAGAMFGGGSGAGGGAGMIGAGTNFSKGLLTILLSVGVSGGAWQYGKMMAAKNASGAAKATSHLFEAKDAPSKYGDTSNVIKAEKSIPNSIGYVNESIDGLTPEERARRAAAAEAARQAEEEAKKKAEDEASKAAANAPASASPVDAKALADAAAVGQAPAAGLASGRYGKLASGFGGGSSLSGGAGLSGGISRNFAGGSDLAQRAQNGSLSSTHNGSRPGVVSAALPKSAISKSKGFAKRQLDNAFSQSRQAVGASRGETAATGAAAPFDNNAGAGNVIAGPGTTSGAKTPAGAADSNGTPNSGGGPIAGSNYTPACQSADYAPDINGTCQLINTPTGVKSASYQNLIDTAKSLMAIIALLALVAIVVEKTWVGTIAAQVLKAVIVTFGVILLGIGAAILSQSGDKMMGGIVMAVGALTIGSAYLNTGLLSSQTPVINQAAGVLISNALGSLAASQASSAQLQ